MPYVYTAPAMPIYEYVCMKCESHFEELVRNGETPTCPDCSSAKVQKQFSVFATHGAAVGAELRPDRGGRRLLRRLLRLRPLTPHPADVA